jgi:DNA-binding response OmpR family regulator
MSRVLIVEDDPHLVPAMRITLQARGYEVWRLAPGPTG